MSYKNILGATLLIASSLSSAQERPINFGFNITQNDLRANTCYRTDNNNICVDLRARESGLERTIMHQTRRLNTRVNTQLSERNGQVRATSTLQHKLGTLSLRAINGELREARYTRPVHDWNVSLAYEPHQGRVRAQLQRKTLQLTYIERDANIQERRFFLAHSHRFNTQLPTELQSGLMLQEKPHEDYSINLRLNVRF